MQQQLVPRNDAARRRKTLHNHVPDIVRNGPGSFFRGLAVRVVNADD
jgi:hypothetical protein